MSPDLLHQLLEAGLDDWVSVDRVAWILSRDGFHTTSREATAAALHDVFVAGLMEPGDLGHSGFEAWPGPPETWSERALSALRELPWPPMGAAFWLNLTDHGRTRLRI